MATSRPDEKQQKRRTATTAPARKETAARASEPADTMLGRHQEHETATSTPARAETAARTGEWASESADAVQGGQDGQQGTYSLALDDQLCFALYAASRAVVARYRPLLDALELTYPQYLVMLVLWEHGETAIKDIGAALQLDYGTLTPLIKRLETAGLVQRRRLPQDERTVEVGLTERGAALRERAESVPPAIGAAMGLSTEEFDEAKRLLRQLVVNVSTN